MKIYEKPMALIEKIEVEDVITSSIVLEGDAKAAFTSDADTTVIVFEW